MAPTFPRELLSVRRRGDEVAPVLAPVDDEHLALAADLVALFREHVGRPREELSRRVEERELRLGTRFKLARGLALLLERRSAFAVGSRVDPASVRRVVFEQSARLCGGAATTQDERARVLAEAGRLLAMAPGEVERALFADDDEALVLAAFDAPGPEWLLRRHNLALAQTLLFDATRLDVWIAQSFRSFLSLVKLHGLMHVVTREPDGTHRVTIDGPVSLFRDTRRYGTAMAKLLPGLARCAPWRLEARVQDPFDRGKERVFRVDSATLPVPAGAPVDEEPSYDSGVEARFAQGWASLRGPWRLLREPAALQVEGGELVIPDFGFAWGDGPALAYLEIVGYWTPEYLARKLRKLRALPPDVPLLLAVDADLGVPAHDFPGDVLPYKGDEVPLVPVVQWLKAREDALVDAEAERVLRAAPPADAPVVSLADLARAHGVGVAAVERALPKLDLGERVRVGDALLTPDALRALDALLSPGMPVAEVERIARARGVSDTSSLLAQLGYAAAWRGLDPTQAVIQRRPRP